MIYKIVNRESEVERSLVVWKGIFTIRIGVVKFINSKGVVHWIMWRTVG
jgi:hypothetical protein